MKRLTGEIVRGANMLHHIYVYHGRIVGSQRVLVSPQDVTSDSHLVVVRFNNRGFFLDQFAIYFGVGLSCLAFFRGGEHEDEKRASRGKGACTLIRM